jgi:DNA-binding MarR family transcriptional regulator
MELPYDLRMGNDPTAGTRNGGPNGNARRPDPESLGSERHERLVRAVDGRFEQVDALVGARIIRWIEESRLDLHEVRVLLALSATKRPMTGTEIAELSGLDIDSAYQAVHRLHGRGLTCEQGRRHELSERGRALTRSFAHAREEGVRAYLGSLDPTEQRRLDRVLGLPE